MMQTDTRSGQPVIDASSVSVCTCGARMCVCQVLDMRIPFLLSSIKDFQQHVPNGQDSMVRLRRFLIQCLIPV